MKLFSEKKVAKSLALADGGKIILIDMLGSPKTTPLGEMNRNVYRIDSDENIVWQVETFAKGDERFSYTNIYIDDEGNLKAYCWDGGEYWVNVDTGKIKVGDLLK